MCANHGYSSIQPHHSTLEQVALVSIVGEPLESPSGGPHLIGGLDCPSREIGYWIQYSQTADSGVNVRPIARHQTTADRRTSAFGPCVGAFGCRDDGEIPSFGSYESRTLEGHRADGIQGPMKFKPNPPIIKRQTVTGSVAEELRRRIVSGEYKGGDQIRQEAVADQLGVSRVPVREALLQLESDGLVVIHTHKGAVVASLTQEDAVDLFEARLLLEPSLLKKAVDAGTQEDAARIGKCLTEYERAVKNGGDPETLSRLNWAFHTALCQPARRPRMMAILVSLYTATDRYLRLQIDHPTAKVKALQDHHAIFDAFTRRQAATASKLIKEHIVSAYHDVMQQLNHRRDAGNRMKSGDR